MTIKQQKIIASALKLFSEQGFTATSTREIAQMADVSEGLIFRHFNSKDGLLDAIMESGLENASRLYTRLLAIDNPRYALKSILRLPFTVSGEDYPFWRLLYILKWQGYAYDAALTASLRKALVTVMEKLGYADPEAEASLVLMFIDGAACTVLLDQPADHDAILEALMTKYELL